MLADLIRAGLATARIERVVAGGRTMEVVRVRIMEPVGEGSRDASSGRLRWLASGLLRLRLCPV